jgi:methyl acetate hydrolase
MKRILLALTVVVAQQTSASIDALLRGAVERKQVPMAVAMVADARGVVYEQAVGANKDAIFAIASMTKPVTSVAVMQLVEAGRVKLDEPAATYLPELATIRVHEGDQLRPPKRPLTVRHLLTHTAGFGYEFLNRELFDLVAKKEIPTVMAGGDAFLKAPLIADPGAQWEYGINTDWLGKLVERVSGQSLEVYFRDRIFTPLGMADSFFNVPAEKRARVVRTFQRGKDGALAELPPPPATPVEFFSGGGGLFSTAPDYLTFVRALMGGGRLGEKRILSTESVAAMGSNQIGDLMVRELPSMVPQIASDKAVLTGGLEKFGLGFALNPKPTSSGRGANTMAWAGIYNTFFWIDREKQVSAVLMSQMLPFLDPGAKKLLEDFDQAVYALRNRPSR